MGGLRMEVNRIQLPLTPSSIQNRGDTGNGLCLEYGYAANVKVSL